MKTCKFSRVIINNYNESKNMFVDGIYVAHSIAHGGNATERF